MPLSGYKTEFYPNLSPGLIACYDEKQIPFQKILPHNNLCSRVFHNGSPVITSLTDGKEYILYADSKQQLQLAFTATSYVSKVYWYINDKIFQ